MAVSASRDLASLPNVPKAARAGPEIEALACFYWVREAQD